MEPSSSGTSGEQLSYPYPFITKASDILVTLRGLWLLLLFDLLAIFAFLVAPQGTDVLLCIAEDVAHPIQTNAGWGTLLWLLVTLIFWSVAAEFCSRLIIYLTDNSGKSLARQRVDFRKSLQKKISNTSLFFPSVLMILAFAKAFWANYRDFKDPSIYLAILICMALIGVVILFLYRLYPGHWIVNLSKKYEWLKWMTISPREDQWVNKLYGIFNDVRVDIYDEKNMYTSDDLPRGIPLPNGITLPDANEFIPYPSNPEREKDSHTGNPTGLKIWMFHIDKKFYRCLLRQLKVLAALALLFIFLFSFLLPVNAYFHVGATALICLAFACWQIVYTCLHFIDKVHKWVTVRFLLLVLLVVTTYVNNDHPVRRLSENNQPSRPSLNEHFNCWYNQLASDSTVRRDSSGAIPVVFIAAEGGALRTGAFTAMMLSKLADYDTGFARHIYCFSGVSGGTLGSNFFNALLGSNIKKSDTLSYSAATSRFFKTDFLAAATGKLVFGEIINYFIPWHINRLDRAIALEKAWEEGWDKMSDHFPPVLRQTFNGQIDCHKPAVFINTTEVETGLQCIWSNVGLDSLPLGSRRDLYQRTRLNLAYSTAIDLSTRFPLVSPGGAISYFDSGFYKKEVRLHYVDGGYYENQGAETLLQVMQALHLEDRKIKPYVLQFNFGNTDSTITSVKNFSEVMEILGGIYNTRSGRSVIATHYLSQYVTKLGGTYIQLAMPNSTKEVPLNWILSQTAVGRVERLIEKMVVPKEASADKEEKAELRKLFIYQKR